MNSLCVICLHEELVAILFPRCRDQSEYSTKRLITTCVLLHIRGSLRNWTIRRCPRPHGGRRWPAEHGWGAMRSRRPGRNGCTRPRACSPFRNVSASNRGKRRETYSHGPYTHPGVVGARCEIVARPGRELERVDQIRMPRKDMQTSSLVRIPESRRRIERSTVRLISSETEKGGKLTKRVSEARPSPWTRVPMRWCERRSYAPRARTRPPDPPHQSTSLPPPRSIDSAGTVQECSADSRHGRCGRRSRRRGGCRRTRT